MKEKKNVFVRFDYDGCFLLGSEFSKSINREFVPVSIIFAKHLFKREDIVPTLRKIADAFESTMPKTAP